MFHQMAQTTEVRSVAVDYLVTRLIPKGLSPALDTLLGTRIVKVRVCEPFIFVIHPTELYQALEHYDLNYDVFVKLFKIFQGLSLYQDPAMRLTLVRLVVVRPIEEGADMATISKDLIQRANLLMPIFNVCPLFLCLSLLP